MIACTISPEEAGRKLNRYVKKLLPDIPDSFLRKTLRGNGFRLNGKRVHDGNLLLEAGDVVQIYLTDEQIASFGYRQPTMQWNEKLAEQVPNIIYEDDNLIILDKPAGMLSQKDKTGDVSLSEIGAAYLYAHGLSPSAGFRPGVCNRLDRGTSGLILMGKNLKTQQELMRMIRENTIEKCYAAVVSGHPSWEDGTILYHDFVKDGFKNQVTIRPAAVKDTSELKTQILKSSYESQRNISFLKIRLLTGKSHQIRAALAYEGFPILGDRKYNPQPGDHRTQLLCAATLHVVEAYEPVQYLRDRTFCAASLPEITPAGGWEVFLR